MNSHILYNLKTLRYYIFVGKSLVLYIVCSKCSSKDEKICKQEESIDIFKVLGFINNIEGHQVNL